MFTNCGDSDDPVADTPTNTTDDNTDDDANTVLDADGDGVADADDTCTDTPEGTEVDENGCEVSRYIYLDENEITLKAKQDAVVGETYELNGVSYLIVDSTMLYEMVVNEEDVTKVVTTFVRNIQGLFRGKSSFNQNISSWDVSNVSDMSSTFMVSGWNEEGIFNQDIGSWDVSSVFKMDSMFFEANFFNQDISS